MNKKSEFILLGLLLVVVLPLEIIAAKLAFHTLGEVYQSLYFLVMIVLNLPFLILAFRSRTLAAIGIAVVALALIPYQFYLGYRLVRMQEETTRIVAYAYEHKASEGAYPADLAGYEFSDPALAAYVQEYFLSEDGADFMVRYRVGTVNTSHWYSSESGWGYYPD